MPIITLDSIWKAYGANDILQGISWQIDPGEKIGLVGHNGCGKTTLFGVLTGKHLPDRGHMHQQRNLHIGFLEQEPTFLPDQTVFDAALEAFADLLNMQHQLRDMELAMSEKHNEPHFLDTYGKLRDRYELDGGYALEARVNPAGVGEIIVKRSKVDESEHIHIRGRLWVPSRVREVLAHRIGS